MGERGHSGLHWSKGDESFPKSAVVYRGKPPFQNMAWRKSKTSATKGSSAGRSGITVKL